MAEQGHAPGLVCQRHRKETPVQKPRRTFHHLDLAAGSIAQAPLWGQENNARCADPLRSRLHLLHAYGQCEPLGNRLAGGSRIDFGSLRSGIPSAKAIQNQISQCAGGSRSDSPHGFQAAATCGPRERPTVALRVDLEARGGQSNGRGQNRKNQNHLGNPRFGRALCHRRRGRPF